MNTRITKNPAESGRYLRGVGSVVQFQVELADPARQIGAVGFESLEKGVRRRVLHLGHTVDVLQRHQNSVRTQ